ncbi:PQQ-binding-like beta-propeller repeat protein [Haloechinothrix sp. LS1_15]|nr:PQQ-binding-like beta-propeller repeat protein [Haloechinothrix sp. LS1_15]
MAAVAVAVLAAAAAGVVWITSDSAATEQRTATEPAPSLEEPEAVPDSFTELWNASSGATVEPVAVGGTAITAGDGVVVGRDARTGEHRWSYRRDLALCSVIAVDGEVTAAYRKGEHCSEVTQLDGRTGNRTAQRTGEADSEIRLLSDGSHLVAAGPTLLNAWSQDLVRTMEYGDVPAPAHPGRQPRPDCRYGSVAVAAGQVGVVERCPEDDAERLTLVATTHQVDDELRSEEPDVLFSELLDGESAQVVALSAAEAGWTAVAVGEHQRLVVYTPDGERHAEYELELPEGDLAGDPHGMAAATARTEAGVYWFTGSGTIALTEHELEPRWTLPGTLGTGTTFAGELLVPIEGGLAVIDEETGEATRTINVDRGAYAGPVRLAATGPVLLEQRGDELVALR